MLEHLSWSDVPYGNTQSVTLLGSTIVTIGLYFWCHSHIPMIRHHLWLFWANQENHWCHSTASQRYSSEGSSSQNEASHAWNIRKTCMARANRYVNILSNFSTSDSMIFWNHFLHCFNIFIWCLRAGTSSARIPHRIHISN